MPSFGFISLIVSEKKISLIFFEILPFVLPQQPIKLSSLDKSHMKRGRLLDNISVEKNQISPMRQQKLSISTFPTKTRLETQLFVPPPIDAMCVI